MGEILLSSFWVKVYVLYAVVALVLSLWPSRPGRRPGGRGQVRPARAGRAPPPDGGGWRPAPPRPAVWLREGRPRGEDLRSEGNNLKHREKPP
jgi:hypothetical protein